MDINDWLSATSLVLSVLTIGLNGIVARSIHRNKLMSKSLYKGFLYLAVLDLLTGILVIPFYCAQFVDDIIERKVYVEDFFFLKYQRFFEYSLQSCRHIQQTL